MPRRDFSQKHAAPRRRTDAGTYLRKDGYTLEYYPEHPRCDLRGYVMQHRLILECSLGRFLTPIERVHHLNGQKSDNRLENLALVVDQSAHMREYHDQTKILDPELVSRAVAYAADSRVSIKTASAALGISHQTLYALCKHWKIAWRYEYHSASLTADQVAKALREFPRSEVPRRLGVSNMTLWRRFPELMRKTATRKLKVWGDLTAESVHQI